MGKFRPLEITISSPLTACRMTHSLVPFGAATLHRSASSFSGLCTERGWALMLDCITAICSLLDNARLALLRKIASIFLLLAHAALVSEITVAFMWVWCRNPLVLNNCGWKTHSRRAILWSKVPSWHVYCGISGNVETQKSFVKKMNRTLWSPNGAEKS